MKWSGYYPFIYLFRISNRIEYIYSQVSVWNRPTTSRYNLRHHFFFFSSLFSIFLFVYLFICVRIRRARTKNVSFVLCIVWFSYSFPFSFSLSISNIFVIHKLHIYTNSFVHSFEWMIVMLVTDISMTMMMMVMLYKVVVVIIIIIDDHHHSHCFSWLRCY